MQGYVGQYKLQYSHVVQYRYVEVTHLEQEKVHGFGLVHGGGYDEHPSVGAQVGTSRDDRSHFPMVLVVVDYEVLCAHLSQTRHL
jgi:hypothetical protein